MRPGGECEAALLRLVASMPFLDLLEAVALSGWSRGGVYPAVRGLERAGLVASVPHASELTAPTRRYCLTADGLRRLSRDEALPVEDLLRLYPVSEEWRRALMERLDAVAVLYRLASALSGAAHPVGFRWYRAMPLDAAVTLPGGITLFVVRQGPTADRTAFAKRLWRLRDLPRPSAVLVLTPDEARLRHARRLLARSPFTDFLALEKEAVSAGAGAAVWRAASGAKPISLQSAVARTGPRGPQPVEEPPKLASLPRDICLHDATDWMLPALLKSTEKRVLDLLSDWPWLRPAHLGALTGLKRSRLNEVVARLNGLGLVLDAEAEGLRRLALSDRGLATLARRDRASVGDARKRWSAARLKPDAPIGWRSVAGKRSRQLLRNIEHTDSVHWFVAALSRQARSRSREILQLDPPRRASRYFRHEGRLRSIHPDAFGVLRRDGSLWPFFLEWERRAVRPATMSARIAPYLRYYSSSNRPTDDHGALPLVLVVFEDGLAATHFLRIAGLEMDRAGVVIPLRVSHRSLLETAGPLGKAWVAAGSPEPGYAFQERSAQS